MSENRDSCDMVRTASTEDFWNRGDLGKLPVGTFAWDVREGVRWLGMRLPSGDYIEIPVVGGDSVGLTTGVMWQWDGNEDKPTLSPSVWTKGCWHGFIRAGRMESC